MIALESVDDQPLLPQCLKAIWPHISDGPDKTWVFQLIKTPVEAWGWGVTHAAWKFIGQYPDALRERGITYSLIPEPTLGASMSRELRCVDLRGGSVVITIPWTDRANPEGALDAWWNGAERGWYVKAGHQGAVLGFAERNNLLVSDRARTLLEALPAVDENYIGSATFENVEGRDSIVLRWPNKESRLTDAVRTLPNRTFKPDLGGWVVPKSHVNYIRMLAEHFNLKMSPEVEALHGKEVTHIRPTVDVYTSKQAKADAAADRWRKKGDPAPNANDVFAIKFVYDPAMMDAMFQIPGREWARLPAYWTVPPQSAEMVQQFVTDFNAEVTPEAMDMLLMWSGVQDIIAASKAHDAELVIEGFGDEKYQPFPFQRAGIRYCLERLGFTDDDNVGRWTRATPTEGGVYIGDEMGLGKEGPVSEPVLTPTGWCTYGNLHVGDEVVGRNGQPTTVTAIFPQGVKEIVRVTMNDGSWTDVGWEHLWAVQHVRNDTQKRHPATADGRWRVKTTREIADDLRDGAGNLNWRVPTMDPVEYSVRPDLSIEPYLLGLWLGNGSGRQISFHADDADSLGSLFPTGRIVELKTRKSKGWVGSIQPEMVYGLHEYDLYEKRSWEKFIPAPYLLGSPVQRLALLQGLMDTDGHALRDGGGTEFSSTSEALIDGIVELAESLGGVARKHGPRVTNYTHNDERREGRSSWRVNIKLPDNMEPFRSPRKLDNWIAPTKYPVRRIIKSIESTGRFEEAVCIRVAAEDHLYVTRHYIVTHNTVQGLGILKAANAFPAAIVVPASLKINWEREAKRWIPGVRVHVIDGTGKMVKSAQGTLFPAGLPDADLYIINYDVVSYWLEKFPTLQGIVVDEGHYIKNSKAARSKATVKLADKVVDTGIRVCMSGTPVVNRPGEFAMQLRLIGRLGEYGGASEFSRRYKKGNRRALSALNRKLRASCYVRRLKVDVLPDLPPKIWAPIVVQGEPTIMREYRKAEADIIKYLVERAEKIAAELSDTDPEAVAKAWESAIRASAAEYLVQLSHLKQISARAKMPAAKEWIQNFVDGGNKLVVFGWHRETVDTVATEFAKGAKIQGGMSMKARQQFVDAFQEDPNQQVISCQIKAAGVGLTLTAASNVLFLEQAWTPGDMEQGADRCHRIGQTDNVMAWNMITENTIDEDIAALIEEKRIVVSRTVDGEIIPTTENEDEEITMMVAGDLLVNLTRRGLTNQ